MSKYANKFKAGMVAPLFNPAYFFDSYSSLLREGVLPSDLELRDGGYLIMEQVGNTDTVLERNELASIRVAKVSMLLTSGYQPWMPDFKTGVPMMARTDAQMLLNDGKFSELPAALRVKVFEAERVLTLDKFFQAYVEVFLQIDESEWPLVDPDLKAVWADQFVYRYDVQNMVA